MDLASAPEVLTVDQAAEILGLSRGAAYEGVKKGDIPSLRIGRRILIPRVQLERMLAGDDAVDISTDPVPEKQGTRA